MSAEKKQMLTIQEFAHLHRKFLVIVVDPRDDMMFMAYRDKQVTGKLKSSDGVDHKIMKRLLKHSTFEHEISRFIGAIVFSLKASIVGWNAAFYQFLGDALLSITKSLKDEKEKKGA